jgi:hypothetical protein
MGTFCQDFWKYLFLSGFAYYTIIGTLVLLEVETTKVKSSNSTVTSVACYITSIVSYLKLIFNTNNNKKIFFALFLVFTFTFSSNTVSIKQKVKKPAMYEPFLEQKSSENDITQRNNTNTILNNKMTNSPFK